MATVGAIACSVGMGSFKKIKNWREAMKHLHSIDRARVLRRSGCVLTYNIETLRHEMEKVDAGQQQ